MIRACAFVFTAVLCFAKATAGQAPRIVESLPLDTSGEHAASNFVQFADRRAIVHCGEMEVYLDTDQGFSLAVASKLAGVTRPLVTSTTVKLWLDDRDQMVVGRGHVANVMILEEGPQRVVLRAPFTLTSRDGRPIATAQYDVVCYPEGEVFTTLRILPLHGEKVQAVMELRFAGDAGLQFERSYDLPLLTGSTEVGPAVGLYWHNGNTPNMGVIGNQMRCVLACQGEGESDERVVSRSFVISVARTRDELRRRCVAHIQPLQPRFLWSCRALIERTPEMLEIASGLGNWCYSFREGTYNFLVEASQAAVEFYNPYDEARHIRLRFVAHGRPALNILANDRVPCEATQVVSLTPDLEARNPGQSSAAQVAFDLPAHDCLLTGVQASDRFLLQFVSGRIVQNTTKRLYRIVTGAAGSCLGEVRVAEGKASGGVEVVSLAGPAAEAQPTLALVSASPLPTEALGRFSRLSELAIVRNQPDRAVLQIKFLNEARTLVCQSNLIFRREDDALALYGYHTIEVLEPLRLLRPTTVDLPVLRISDPGAEVANRPLRFFYADGRKRIRICPRSAKPGFGYELGSFNRSVHPDFALCGFVGGTSSALAFLGRPLVGTGKLVAAESSPTLSMRLHLPTILSRSQRFLSMWKTVIPSSGETNLRSLQVSLNSLKGHPVDLTWTAKQIKVSDGYVAHRVSELSSSGNPASDDRRSYLLDGGEELAVVGTGTDGLRWPWMFHIRALGLEPGRVRKIFLTDAGVEHAGGARALKQLTGAAIHLPASATEALSVAGPEQDQRTAAHWHSGSRRFESVGVDRALRDGETILVGDLAVRFLHTPGPSGESGTYLVNAGGLGVALVGNLLETTKEGNQSPFGLADAHRHGNLDEWIRSLKRLRAEHCDLVAPSLSPPLSGTEQINIMCDRMIERCNAILRVKGIDRILPRPLVAGRDRRGDIRLPVVRDDLWGVKETERAIGARTRPVELADCLWRVGGGFAAENEDANIYLLDGGSEMALIGAGSGLHTRAIIDRILALGKNPLDINYILLPSSHWYEARGANSLRTATRARVCAHRYETAALWRGDALRTGLMIGDFSFAVFPPFRVDRVLEWGETIRVGKHEIFVLDAPGFHRGSTAFLMTIDRLRFLATGQTAYGDLPVPDDETADGAMGWMDPHWGGNVTVWRQTIERYLALQPDVLLPGQGPAQDEELERQLRDCLARLDQLREIQKATGLFPSDLFEITAEPVRPDISRLKPKR